MKELGRERAGKMLRLLVVAQIVLVLMCTILSIVLDSYLPPPLHKWKQIEAEQEISKMEVFILIVAIPCLLGLVVGLVGLYFRKRWAAWCYFAAVLIGFLVSPFVGPTVEHGLSDTFWHLSSIVDGGIFMLAFFSGALPSKAVDELRGKASTLTQRFPL
jgi:hypothetical protein